MENKETLSVTSAPHIHGTDSVTKQYWGRVAALIPVFLVAFFLGKTELFRFLLLSLVSATAFEFLGAKLFKRKDKLYHGEAILMAAWVAVLMPQGCPSEMVILANFLAVLVAKECFGGMGQYLLHPALFARVFLQESFPNLIKDPILLDGAPWTWIAIAVGILILIRQRQGYWETPLLYIAVSFFCVVILGRWGGEPFRFLNGVFLIAFLLLADPIPMPLTRGGTCLFVMGAAFLTAVLSPRGFSMTAAGFSVLLMNLLTPWMDLGRRLFTYKLKQLPERSGNHGC